MTEKDETPGHTEQTGAWRMLPREWTELVCGCQAMSFQAPATYDCSSVPLL